MVTALFTLVFGAIGAAIDQGFAGFFYGAGIGFLLGRQIVLSERLTALQKTVEKAAAAGPAPATVSAQATIPPAATPAPSPPRAAAARTDDDRPKPVAAPPSPPPRTAPLPPPPIKPDWTATQLARAKDWLQGGNPLARAGIVILFFGGAFLAKYAADNSMFPLELRLAALAAGGLVLLVLGWRLRTTRATFAQILQGGGIAGMYLTVFAATRLYHLLPHGFALGLLIAVAVAGALLAVAQNSLSLAVIGFAGGFLAPILLSTGGGSHVALFTYYTVLNVGVFTVAWFRAWRVLNLVGFVFTFGITALWRGTAYQPEDLVSADFFLLLFFAMYVAISVLFAIRQKPDLKGYVSASLVFGLPVIVTSLHASLVKHIEYAMAWSALGFGLAYLALAFVLFRTARDSLRLLAEAFAALGVAFASLAIPLAFDQGATALLWAVEGAGLLWLGVRQDRKLARAFAILLQLVAGLRFAGELAHDTQDLLFLNGHFLGGLSLAAAGLFSAGWLQRGAGQRARYEQGWDAVLLGWGALWLVVAGLVDIERHADREVAIGLSLAYLALAALALEAWGARWPWSLPRHLALGVPALGALLGLVWAVQDHPFARGGSFGWPVLLAAHYFLLWRLDREPERSGLARAWLHAGGLWVLTAVIAPELHWQLERAVPGVWATLVWGVVPAGLVGLLARRELRPAWPLARHAESYRHLAALPLAAVAALWVFGANLSSRGDPAWLPYIPLINPLDLASAFVLLSLAWWTARLAPRPLWLPRGPVIAAFAGLAFVWLSAALVRALHYRFGTPIDASGIAHSTFVQSALSIFWGLLGFTAMLVATRNAVRAAWIAGAVLMGIVVIKLFLVDLSGSGTLARIVSFLSVGALLLVTGYLSPLPPRKPEPEPTA